MLARRPAAIATALAVALAALAAVPSVAQSPPTTIEAEVRVIPNKAGTPKDPQPVRIVIDGKLTSPEGEERPILQGGTVLLPRAGLWNGAKHPKCALTVLERDGPTACPKGSIFGKGTAKAYADEVVTRPKITLVNGGATRAYAYVVLNNPARVQAPVVGKIKKLPRGPWGYRVSFEVPQVLQVVAGVPIAGTEIHLEIGKGDIIVSTSCPANRRWEYKATARLSNGQSPVYESFVPCRPSGRR